MRYRRDDVVARAIEVLDAHGLDALSMRRLAGDLGVQPGALYHHFTNKDALLAAIADEILRRGRRPAEIMAWDAEVQLLCLGLRDAMRRHRDGAAWSSARRGWQSDRRRARSRLPGAHRRGEHVARLVTEAREDTLRRLAAERAYTMAGITPQQIDAAEVHDCFTITEILDIEDLGFFAKGDGGRASLEGETSLTGRIPVNTSGGLLAKGHPIGATGVAQITECWWQLRGEAEGRQVEIRNGFALQHNAGGRGSGVSVVNILTNRPS